MHLRIPTGNQRVFPNLLSTTQPHCTVEKNYIRGEPFPSGSYNASRLEDFRLYCAAFYHSTALHSGEKCIGRSATDCTSSFFTTSHFSSVLETHYSTVFHTATLPHCHIVTLSHCHTATLPHYCCITVLSATLQGTASLQCIGTLQHCHELLGPM